MSSTPFPKSDVDVPSGRQMANRKSFRNSSMKRSDSFDADATSDDSIKREDPDEGMSSTRLSAALADEREETRKRLTKELEAEEEPPEEVEDNEDEGDSEGDPGTMMSLMDLLEETDRKAGVEGPNYRFDGDEGEGEEEEEEEEEEGEKEVNCCVCRVKHKGSVLPLCGHSYCRMCSRDMAIQKGHCPACTNFVLEILEIF